MLPAPSLLVIVHRQIPGDEEDEITSDHSVSSPISSMVRHVTLNGLGGGGPQFRMGSYAPLQKDNICILTIFDPLAAETQLRLQGLLGASTKVLRLWPCHSKPTHLVSVALSR